MEAQATVDGGAGAGFSITPFGKQWIQEKHQDTFIPTEPERFAQMLQPLQGRFGPHFYARAQEAVRCYGAHAYFACCAMCGAAAESVLIETAIAKGGDADAIHKIYMTSGGRSRLENMLIGQAAEGLKREFRGLTSLLKYWRDQAAHGAYSRLTDNEAYTSLAMLLRYASFVNDNWNEFTQAPSKASTASNP